MFDRDTAKDQANRITAAGKAVGFPANLKVYTGGKSPGVDKWLVYARAFDAPKDSIGSWQYLETADDVEGYLEELA